MRKRIYASMIFLTIASVLFITVILCFVFYNQYSKSVQSDLRERTEIYKILTAGVSITDPSHFRANDMRVTLIEPDGTVIFDDTVSADTLPNHLDREEVIEALEKGYGESKRFSDTIGQETYYYAIKLDDGTILRLAKTTNSIFMIIRDSLTIIISVVLLIIIVGYIIAGRLTKRIVEPINKVNFTEEQSTPYDELSPFVKTIAEQRERIEQQVFDLNERAETISAIMDSMNEGIVIVNRQGVILSINKSAESIFETKVAMNGKNILELLRDVELLDRVRNALSGSRSEMSIEQSNKTYRVYFSPVTDSGAIILFLDITEKIMSEKIRREFSANVSHELKTPLTSIYGYAEMLYNGMVKESDKRDFTGKIKDEASRLIMLIQDIIMISELDEDKYPGSFEDVDLKTVAEETVQALSMKVSDNKISVSITGENTVVKANRSLIYEMLYNLIDNAVKYNKQQGLVTIETGVVGGNAKITISDTGIGIPKEAQSRVFERFYRVDKSRSKNTGGTGLGLAIVKHIVLVHGGKIELQSKKNEGTKISIMFPTT